MWCNWRFLEKSLYIGLHGRIVTSVVSALFKFVSFGCPQDPKPTKQNKQKNAPDLTASCISVKKHSYRTHSKIRSKTRLFSRKK